MKLNKHPVRSWDKASLIEFEAQLFDIFSLSTLAAQVVEEEVQKTISSRDNDDSKCPMYKPSVGYRRV